MRRNFTSLLLLADLVALVLAFALGQGLRLGDFSGSLPGWWQAEGQFRIQALALVTLLMLFSFGPSLRHYFQRKPFWDELYDVLRILAMLLLIDAAFMFFNKWQFSRLAFGVQWLSLFLLLPGLRLLLKLVLLRTGHWQVPVVLVGSGPNGREAWLALQSEGLMGYRLAAVVTPPSARRAVDWSLPVNDWDAGLALLAAPGHKQVVLALEADEPDLDVGRRLTQLCEGVLVVPPTRGLPLLGMEPLHAFSHEVLLLRARNNLLRPWARLVKRLFDVVVSVLLLVLLAPVFAWLVLKVRRDGGNAFFGHQRIGRGGVPFYCYKFRTMVPNSAQVLDELLRSDPEARAEWEREFKLRNDPRITPIGDFLRRSSLDELPQLWNVLRGDMSLVGPRPVVRDELAKYGEDVSYYFQVRPGMTGLWQVSGRNDVDYDTRVALDAWYVRNWSLWNDIVILIKTVKVVLFRDGAY